MKTPLRHTLRLWPATSHSLVTSPPKRSRCCKACCTLKPLVVWVKSLTFFTQIFYSAINLGSLVSDPFELANFFLVFYAGSGKGGAKQIKEHAWFAGFDWDALENRNMTAPIVPIIKSDIDLDNFEKYPETNDEIVPFDDGGVNVFADF